MRYWSDQEHEAAWDKACRFFDKKETKKQLKKESEMERTNSKERTMARKWTRKRKIRNVMRRAAKTCREALRVGGS
jgi:hypothetical protein